MNTRTRLLIFALLVAGALPAQAQTPAAEIKDSGGTTLWLLDTDAGLKVLGSSGTGSIPAEGAGVRLMWYPGKAAFRAGRVNGTQWDDANVGPNSTAMGFNTTASGFASTAMGLSTTASGPISTAMGNGTTASGPQSTAMGNGTKASGPDSTAMGANTMASGNQSTAMGQSTTASGFQSTAMGNGTTASSFASTAMGNGTTASGTASTAMGLSTTASGTASTAMGRNASTGGFVGSFVYGDFSAAFTSIVTNTAANQFMVRAAGGTTFFSSSDLSTGVTLAPGGGSFASVSDSTRKTHFRAADGETVLASLRRLRLGSWTYRGQDPARHRHYGPMAQEFFAAYGHDGLGVIGTDTTIATADADGVLFIAAQALERRTREQQARIEALEARIEVLEAALRDRDAATEARLAVLEATLGRRYQIASRAAEPAALPLDTAPGANR